MGSAGFRLCCPDAVNTVKRRSWQGSVPGGAGPGQLAIPGTIGRGAPGHLAGG